MEEDDDKEIEVAKKKGENFYKLLKAKKIDIDAVFKAIIDTTNYERQIMNDYISKTHSMSIIKALELTFSGNLREILIYMFYSPYELDARLLNAALKSFRMDYKLIVEIFASRPKWYLELIDQEYKKLYKVTLKSELEKKKTKNFNKFLLCLFETEREEGPHIDVKEAEKIVEEMFKKGLKAYGTDLELFKKVFVTKSREDFILISRVFYKNNPKKINLYQACDEQVGSDNRELLKALVYAICDSSHYFGHNLKKAIVGFGTNVKVLNRILALRSEIDMDVIRERYLGETKRDLIEAIKGDTSGDYCKFLCMLASRNPKVTE
jgi:annexin A7/11